MATPKEKLEVLRKSLDVEIKDIMDKMPWYKTVAIWLSIGMSVGVMSAACGIITIGSAGSGLIPCAIAMGALIFVLIGLLVENLAADKEADALEKKAQQMEELVAEMEAG